MSQRGKISFISDGEVELVCNLFLPSSILAVPCPFRKLFPSQLKKDDIFFMSQAYNEAVDAYDEGEIPIGAVIVLGEQIIATAHNRVSTLKDPTAHAEILAITQAALKIGDWRLNETKLYVTKEPCPMCSGAIILSRIDEVIYSFPDPKMGCLGGAFSLMDLPEINHRPQVKTNVLREQCYAILRHFFEVRRNGENINGENTSSVP
ncbi:MAG: nucleoside deaminase [Puniceicoccales bacterium]|jgi:tRNA(adenine34) deaminase|nr:nucleoside deaminase [Puniceicoccales bacterium]